MRQGHNFCGQVTGWGGGTQCLQNGRMFGFLYICVMGHFGDSFILTIFRRLLRFMAKSYIGL